MRRAVLALSLASLAIPAHAQDGCADLVGTYLTVKLSDAGAPAADTRGRSLLSLMAGGVAIMADSAQGGLNAYPPFTTAHGAWTCVDGGAGFAARLVDFTFATEANPEPQLVTVDTTATVAENGATSGDTTVAFFGIGADPRSDAPNGDTRYAFTGYRIDAER